MLINNIKINKIVKFFLLELAIWSTFVGTFLSVYVLKFGFSSLAIRPHLLLIGSVISSLFIIRCIAWRFLWSAIARIISIALTTSLLIVLNSYYLVTILGLEAWGRVISWSLIVSYLSQASELIDALGLSVWPVLSGFMVTVVISAGVATLFLKRFDWIPLLVPLGSRHGVVTIYALVCLTVGVVIWDFMERPAGDMGEPISLTFFPDPYSKRKIQTHYVHHVSYRDSLEHAARVAYRPAPEFSGRNVILIVVDALRADRLSINGYARNTTPNLLRYKRAGVLLNNGSMYSACAESSCGLLAIASSRYVHQFPTQPLTLQEILRNHGYRIHMVLSGDHTNFYGLRDAYGTLDSFYDGSIAKGHYINDDALVVDEVSRFESWGGDPVFIQLHLMSAHGLGKRAADRMPFLPARNYYAEMGSKMLASHWEPHSDYSNFYDNGVYNADATIQKVLDLLNEKGYLQNTLVVITADHGEMLGEHGKFSHTKGLYDPVLRIPFSMLRFGYENDEDIGADIPASHVDIAPTILFELGIQVPSIWSGVALQDLTAGRKAREFIFFQQGSAYGLLDARDPSVRWKYWNDAAKNSENVFDLTIDPNENANMRDHIDQHLRSVWWRELVDMSVFAHAHVLR
jgi:glucan phosphoethanolaminetransferase (alkaline phosphatase superfamily)